MARGPTVKVRVTGIREIEAAFREMAETFSKPTGVAVMRRALTNAAKPIAADTKTRVRKRTRRLMKSIRVSTKLKKTPGGDSGFDKTASGPRRKGLKVIRVFIGSTESFLHLQEFGTARHGAQPALRPAWDSGKARAIGSIHAALKTEIEKTKKRLAARAARKATKAKRR